LVEVLAIVVGSILLLLGIAGCILPVLPGPPLSFAGLFLLALTRHFAPPLTVPLLVVMAGAALGAVVLDYILPAVGVKKYGASKWGVRGSLIGMLLGILFFPPLGIFVGALAGAVIGEWLALRQAGAALRAGWGVFVGTLFGVVLKLAASGVITYYFVAALVQG